MGSKYFSGVEDGKAERIRRTPLRAEGRSEQKTGGRGKYSQVLYKAGFSYH